jgi:hypothetical protein
MTYMGKGDDRMRFVLEAQEWRRFVEALDRAPRENPGLAKLFSKPSVFEPRCVLEPRTRMTMPRLNYVPSIWNA